MTWAATSLALSAVSSSAGSWSASSWQSLSMLAEPEPTSSSVPESPEPSPTPSESTGAPVPTCGATPEQPCWVATDPPTTLLLGFGLAALVLLAAARLVLGLRR